MTKSNIAPVARRWPHIAGLASAGVLSFVLAVSVRTWTSTGTDEENSVVMPIERASHATGRTVGTQASQPRADLRNASETSTAPLQVSTVRMDHRVTQDPFGALNLMASVEPDNRPALPNDPLALTSRKQRKPKTAPPQPSPPPIQALALPIAPPPATAPPIPFTAVGAIHGSQIAGGHPVVFLRQREEVLAVRSGDTIGQSYRVENITPDKIEFTYLPLKQRQSLSLTP